MNDIISGSNLKKAGAVALAVYLASSFTASQSKLVQGAAMFAAAAVALPFASKL
jgi:hypothetical protein